MFDDILSHDAGKLDSSFLLSDLLAHDGDNINRSIKIIFFILYSVCYFLNFLS